MSYRADNPRKASGGAPVLAITLVLLGSSALVQAAPPRPVSAAQRAAFWRESTAAVRSLVERRHVEAVTHAARAHAAQASPELDALVGLVALAGGKTQQAAQQLEAAIRHRSSEPLVFYWAGRAALAAGRRKLAAKRFEEAVAIGARYPALQLAYALTATDARAAGTALEAAARQHANVLDSALYPSPEQGAIRLLERLLRGFPRRLALLRTQANLYLQVDAVPAAYERVRQMLKQRKDDAEALQLGARCWAALGQLSTALRWARRAVAQEPGLPTARATLGELLLAQGKARAASAELLRAANARPRDVALLLATALACGRSEQRGCADRFYGYALRRDPRLAAAHFGVAVRAQQLGRKDRARLAFQRAIDLDPAKPRYYEGAAQFASLDNRPAPARRLLAEARLLRRQQAPLQRRQARALRVFRQVAEALRRCGCGAACRRASSPPCEQAAQRVYGVAGDWLRAHLALQRGRRSAARKPLLSARRRLHVNALLSRDPRVFVVSGRTLGGVRYQVRKVFPMALIPPLPPVTSKKPAK